MLLGTSVFLGGLIPLTYPQAYKHYHRMGVYDRTILTHMISHSTTEHWIMNISNLVFSASFLDLGFIKSILLFLGSGLGGLGALYINRYFQHPLQKLLPVRVIGSSAAVYGFMGAEISTCLLSVYRQATKKYNRVEKHVAQLSIASTLNLCIVRLLQFAYQLSIEGDEKVGHFGGFVTGALFSLLL